MAKQAYPIALCFPPEVVAPAGGDHHPLALLSPAQQRQLLADLQEMARIEVEFLAAQRAISQIDLQAAAIACQTMQAAELVTLLYGGLHDLEAFAKVRREQYLQMVHELVAQAHAQILARLQRRVR